MYVSYKLNLIYTIFIVFQKQALGDMVKLTVRKSNKRGHSAALNL